MSDEAATLSRRPRRTRRDDMPDAAPTGAAPRPVRVPRPALRGQAIPSVADLRSYLSTLEGGPMASVHINGPQHQQAVVVVDFGTPLKQNKLTPEQTQELVSYMRRATRDVMGRPAAREANGRDAREARVGLYNDQANGIWWTTAG